MIIEASTLKDFEEEINKKLQEGWILYKGMQVTSAFRTKNSIGYESKSFYQMVFKDKE